MFKKKVKQVIYVEGMSCKHCVSRVKSALEELEDIEKVKINLDNGEVTIFSKSEINSKKINNIIEDLGYKVKE